MKTFQGRPAHRLEEIVDRVSRKARIAVLGDFFLDKYLDVDRTLAETSVETGRTAHQVVRVRHSPGAAGTVMSNLSALEAGTLYAIGFTGDDGESYDLRRDLAAMRCSTEHLHVAADRMTPQYLKPRYIDDPTLAGEHDRLDTKNRSATPGGAPGPHHRITRRASAVARRGHHRRPGGGGRLRRRDRAGCGRRLRSARRRFRR